MGSNKVKTVDMSNPVENTDTKTHKTASQEPKKSRSRSNSYTWRRSQVDKTQHYSVDKAVELIKKLTTAKHPTITADINYRDSGYQTEFAFPHSTGKSIKVAIADDKILEQIEKGQIDFDVLLAKPDMMPKIAKHARILGPKGLMPNPKNKTVTPDPQKRKKELEGGKVNIRSEKKAPLLHIQIGSCQMKDSQLVDNLKALYKHLGSTQIQKITLSSTMSPGVKVDLTTLTQE